MKAIKEFFARLFADKWDYYEGMSIRVHQETGKVEYWHQDAWSGYYDDMPQFSDEPLFIPPKK